MFTLKFRVNRIVEIVEKNNNRNTNFCEFFTNQLVTQHCVEKTFSHFFLIFAKFFSHIRKNAQQILLCQTLPLSADQGRQFETSPAVISVTLFKFFFFSVRPKLTSETATGFLVSFA